MNTFELTNNRGLAVMKSTNNVEMQYFERVLLLNKIHYTKNYNEGLDGLPGTNEITFDYLMLQDILDIIDNDKEYKKIKLTNSVR